MCRGSLSIFPCFPSCFSKKEEFNHVKLWCNQKMNNVDPPSSLSSHLACWSSLALPAIVLALSVYFGRPFLADPKIWKSIKLGILVIIFLSGASMAGQAALCLGLSGQHETAKSWGVAVGATGISGLTIVVLLAAIAAYAVVYGMR